MNPLVSSFVAKVRRFRPSAAPAEGRIRASPSEPGDRLPRQRKHGCLRSFLLIVAAIGFGLVSGACKGTAPEPPPPRIPDMVPVGDGMKTLAYAVVGAAVVLTLGRMTRQ